jgi:phenylpyruvate tautomerase PptA (4-oxalocrotonate tautomerase family)
VPKMFVHSRQGAFSDEARAEVAAALTDLGIDCERLAKTEQIRKGVWVIFSEHAPSSVFSGGKVASDSNTAVIAYTLQGGLDDDAKQRLIVGATSIINRHIQSTDGQAPVYVGIIEVPESNWGMYGKRVSLAAMRGE